jgi:hypothetical protein
LSQLPDVLLPSGVDPVRTPGALDDAYRYASPSLVPCADHLHLRVTDAASGVDPENVRADGAAAERFLACLTADVHLARFSALIIARAGLRAEVGGTHADTFADGEDDFALTTMTMADTYRSNSGNGNGMGDFDVNVDANAGANTGPGSGDSGRANSARALAARVSAALSSKALGANAHLRALRLVALARVHGRETLEGALAQAQLAASLDAQLVASSLDFSAADPEWTRAGRDALAAAATGVGGGSSGSSGDRQPTGAATPVSARAPLAPRVLYRSSTRIVLALPAADALPSEARAVTLHGKVAQQTRTAVNASHCALVGTGTALAPGSVVTVSGLSPNAAYEFAVSIELPRAAASLSAASTAARGVNGGKPKKRSAPATEIVVSATTMPIVACAPVPAHCVLLAVARAAAGDAAWPIALSAAESLVAAFSVDSSKEPRPHDDLGIDGVAAAPRTTTATTTTTTTTSSNGAVRLSIDLRSRRMVPAEHAAIARGFMIAARARAEARKRSIDRIGGIEFGWSGVGECAWQLESPFFFFFFFFFSFFSSLAKIQSLKYHTRNPFPSTIPRPGSCRRHSARGALAAAHCGIPAPRCT